MTKIGYLIDCQGEPVEPEVFKTNRLRQAVSDKYFKVLTLKLLDCQPELVEGGVHQNNPSSTGSP